MVKEYDKVKTLMERNGYPIGSIGIVVSIYSTGPACEVELWDENQHPIDVVTYLFRELEVIDSGKDENITSFYPEDQGETNMYHIILKESDLIHENHFPAIALINEAFNTDPLEFIHNLSLGIGSGYNYASCSFWDELDDFDKANIPRFHGLRIVTEGNEELVISMSELIFYLETACNTLANAGVKDAPEIKKAIEILKAAT